MASAAEALREAKYGLWVRGRTVMYANLGARGWSPVAFLVPGVDKRAPWKGY